MNTIAWQMVCPHCGGIVQVSLTPGAPAATTPPRGPITDGAGTAATPSMRPATQRQIEFARSLIRELGERGGDASNASEALQGVLAGDPSTIDMANLIDWLKRQ